MKKVFAGLAALALFSSVALAQVATNLPNAMAQFVDGSGAPYAVGQVYTYVPGTTTPKATWQDPYGLTLNTNPIVLDGNGRALIYGSGAYREVLKDFNGNTIWDQITYGISPISTSTVSIPNCSGAGVGGACGIIGTNQAGAGVVAITAGSGAGASGSIQLVFSGKVGTNESVCVFSVVNGTGSWAAGANIIQTATPTNGVTFAWANGGGTALTSGLAYNVNYMCSGN